MPTVISPTDLDILQVCYQLRFATIAHLSALTNRERNALNRRILQLIAEKYIYRVTFPNPNQKHIYTLGIEGFKHLAHLGLIHIDEVPTRFRASELKPLFLEHALFISDIHATLILATRNNHLELTEWREGKSIYDSVTFFNGIKKERLPVCPDGFFEIRNNQREAPRNKLAFVLEADRSTTTRRTFQDKLVAYTHYLDQKRQVEFFKVGWFRVVTLTLTQARADSLANLANEIVDEKMQKFFLFASREHFSLDQPNSIYDEIYKTPRDENLISLMPN